jgi:hypothetical protein
MKKGKEPLRTFGDLLQFVKIRQEEEAPSPTTKDMGSTAASPPLAGAEEKRGESPQSAPAASEPAPTAEPSSEVVSSAASGSEIKVTETTSTAIEHTAATVEPPLVPTATSSLSSTDFPPVGGQTETPAPSDSAEAQVAAFAGAADGTGTP